MVYTEYIHILYAHTYTHVHIHTYIPHTYIPHTHAHADHDTASDGSEEDSEGGSQLDDNGVLGMVWPSDHLIIHYLGNSEDEGMSAIMEEMDRELAESEMGKTFEREKVCI